MGDRVRRVQADREESWEEACAREGRRESPAVHLLCRGLLRSHIKSVSDALRFPSPLRSPCLYCILRVLLRLYTSSTRYEIPDGPSHDNCPSTVFRLSSFAFGGNDPTARVRAIGPVPANCEPLAIVLLIRETLLKSEACNPIKKIYINNSNCCRNIFCAQ